MMVAFRGTRRMANGFRWVARVWSLGVLAMALMIALSPDPHSTGEPIPVGDLALLSLWGVAVVGLQVAWRFETVGAVIAIVGAVANYIGFRVVRGAWPPGANFIVIPVVVFVVPAILYLLARHYSRSEDGSIGA